MQASQHRFLKLTEQVASLIYKKARTLQPYDLNIQEETCMNFIIVLLSVHCIDDILDCYFASKISITLIMPIDVNFPHSGGLVWPAIV